MPWSYIPKPQIVFFTRIASSTEVHWPYSTWFWTRGSEVHTRSFEGSGIHHVEMQSMAVRECQCNVDSLVGLFAILNRKSPSL